jgi:hypothetical protein
LNQAGGKTLQSVCQQPQGLELKLHFALAQDTVRADYVTYTTIATFSTQNKKIRNLLCMYGQQKIHWATKNPFLSVGLICIYIISC